MKMFHSQKTDLKFLFAGKFKLSLMILAVLISLSATAKHIHEIVNPQPKETDPSQKENTLDNRYRQAMSTSGKVTFVYIAIRYNLNA